MLVQTMSPIVAPALENVINEGQVAQAALPVGEIFGLFEIIVRPIQTALLGLTIVICVVSGISILVSIYNSMNDRRHEIAVMRALGASRGTVFAIILFESIFLSLGGGLFGWIGGHTLNALASAKIEQVTGVSLSFFDFAPAVNVLELLGQEPTIEWLAISTELLLVPGLILLAVIVGFLPAFSAYRTDVSRSLGT
jgi:putative ABC transport system permease protein